MSGKGVIIIALLIVFALLLGLGANVSVGRASSSDGAQSDGVLLEEVRGLRHDIAGLRSDIKDLRAELGTKQPAKNATQSNAQGVSVIFSLVPRSGEGPRSQGNIAGRVIGLPNNTKNKIVIYAHTDRWYVQPLIAEPFTAIKSDGTWSNWTHLGYRYAALVVKPSFQPEARPDSLPAVGDEVIAIGEVAARQ